MEIIKKIGLYIFIIFFGLFIALPLMTHFRFDQANIEAVTAKTKEAHQAYLPKALNEIKGEELGGKFSFFPRMNQIFKKINQSVQEDFGVEENAINKFIQAAKETSAGTITVSEASHKNAVSQMPEGVQQTISDYTNWLIGRTYESEDQYNSQIRDAVNNAVNGYVNNQKIAGEDKKFYLDILSEQASKGLFWENKNLFFFLIYGVGILGGLMFIIPMFYDGEPGIKNDRIFHDKLKNQGWIGMSFGIFLIAFYIFLYKIPYLIQEWIALTDPVSQVIRGEDANQWFMYGFMYTVAILIMGIRMFAKYRHSNYHKIRTASVMFFQTAFAFLIPQILFLLNLPENDLKNIWPLNYTMFFDYNIQNHIDAGSAGIFMLVWGIILVLIGVPLLTYFFGKRWYCSWVCGCGGLAETLGDPFRQLSDKSLNAWRIERILIHSVLVFAVVMTGMVLYTYFTGSSTVLGMNSYAVRGWYGFLIGFIFAGAVGTGFYPIMGNRVWCRFGCPLAAYLGIVQRFKSRFRITTNGGQCISCGNCSTYCEMGIDVRAYAQRGQNIVRASCVGCGVCAAVCPRGVLALENGSNTDYSRMSEHQY